MNKNNRYNIQILLLSMIAIVSIGMSVYVLQYEWYYMKISNVLVMVIMVVVLLEVVFIFLARSRFNNRKDEIYILDKLLKYSKKRSELEQEINLLTRELMHSNLAEYLDVNRLVFLGQDTIDSKMSIHYDSFFKQFGLLNEKIEIRKNSAVFLTPFTPEGNILFNECQKILGGVDIFLQKTDNYVEKDDIMMNIVSLIVQSEIVIVNINGRNPNVYYELGISHAIGKPTILISEMNFNLDEIGFDIRQKRIIMYNSIDDLEKQLLYQVSRLKKEM